MFPIHAQHKFVRLFVGILRTNGVASAMRIKHQTARHLADDVGLRIA